MSKRYTRLELLNMGMSEKQINAILDTYDKEDEAVERGFNVVEDNNVVEMYNSDTHKKELKVTTISDIKGYEVGSIIELPPFAEGQPFVVRITRPSMLLLAKEGKIPNSLMNIATQLFTGTKSVKPNDSSQMMREMYDVCEIICRASLLEPKYDELVEAGIKLTDEQITAIFNYTQRGVKALESFR